MPEFEAIATRGKYEELIRTYPLNIAAPTDDTPFFFHMLRAGRFVESFDVSGDEPNQLKGRESAGHAARDRNYFERHRNHRATDPAKRVRESHSDRLMIYFASIGLAFMMVEIGQLERLIVFLGHPIYGLTVVLFVLLVASSLGSLRVTSGPMAMAVAAFARCIHLGSPAVTRELAGASTPVRIPSRRCSCFRLVSSWVWRSHLA